MLCIIFYIMSNTHIKITFMNIKVIEYFTFLRNKFLCILYIISIYMHAT